MLSDPSPVSSGKVIAAARRLNPSNGTGFDSESGLIVTEYSWYSFHNFAHQSAVVSTSACGPKGTSSSESCPMPSCFLP